MASIICAHGAAGKIGAADRADKEGVAGKAMRCAVQADAAGGMAGGVNDLELFFADGDDVAVLDDHFNGR